MRMRFLLVCVFIFAFIAYAVLKVEAEENDDGTEESEFFKMDATAYCVGTTRCDGLPIRCGVCAGKKEWYGNLAIIYEDNHGIPGEFLGYFECLDTGGEAIRAGRTIDIYMPDYNDCKQFGRKKVLVKIISGKG